MRRLKLTVIIWLISIIFLAAESFADGTVSIQSDTIFVDYRAARRILTLSFVGDGENGTIPDTVINPATYAIEGWFLYSAETNPGSPAPTPAYNIVINDTDDVDIAGGLLIDRDTSVSELVNFINASHRHPIIRGNVTVTFANQAVGGAKGTLILIFVPELCFR